MAINLNGTGSITGLTSISSPTISGGSLPAGDASAPGLTFSGDTNTGIYSPGADQVAISTSGTQRINIEADGDINIDSGGVFYDATNNRLAVGTTSPGAQLEIGSTSAAVGSGALTAFEIQRSDSTNALLTMGPLEAAQTSVNPGAGICSNNRGMIISNGATDLSAGEGIFLDNPSSSLRLHANDAERARIDSSGRLLVGTTSPTATAYNLEVYRSSGSSVLAAVVDTLANGEYVGCWARGGGTTGVIGVFKHSGIATPCPYLSLPRESGTSGYYWTDNSGNFRTSTSNSHIGTTSGTVVGTQTSDERLKNVLGPVEFGLGTIKQIEPVRYTLKSEPDTERLGFIAQQVLPLVPQSVFDTAEHIEGLPEDAPTKLGMEYVSLIPVLVNAIKELSAKNDALEARLAVLESA